jgi:hypothetical protein
VDTFPQDVGGDPDLDALMVRVREAAMTGNTAELTTSGPRAQTSDPAGSDFDLMRVIEAQGEWNEQTRKSIAAMVSSLRTLRDDWADAHARVCQELEQLTTLVDRLRSASQQRAGRKAKATRPRLSIKPRAHKSGAVNGRRP